MNQTIIELIDAFTRGRMSRRELIAAMSGLVAAAATGHTLPAHGDDAAPTFKALALNHIALRVTDVPRSRDFYMKHLGMTIANESLPNNCFLNFENGFLTLFRGNEPRLDHYCYSIENYEVQAVAAKLRSVGIEPRIEGDRLYFPDPDLHTVQLASPNHRA